MENISVFDLVVTVLLATATFWGGLRGVVSQISAIATWILSGLAAARYGSVVGDVVSIPEPWRAPVSALIVFCASLLALSVATRFVKRVVSLAGLKEFDRQAGALFGFLKGCAICVVLTFFAVLGSEKTRDLVDDSRIGPYLASCALLLKGAFPQSETMTRFETLVGQMESTQVEGKIPSLNSEIVGLENYLKDNVLSKEAAEVVEEVESGSAAENGVPSSGWSRFWNDLRARNGARETNESVSTNATDFGDSYDDARNENRNVGESREVERNDGAWRSWEIWRSWEDGDARGGTTNDGYYDEYEENSDGTGADEYYERRERDEYTRYNDYAEYEYGERVAEERSEFAQTSSGWSDLATFLTNITGGSRLTSGANEGNGAANERRTSNGAASEDESLNEFLGVASNVNARNAAPTFDVSAPRTTDGAILGRPNMTSTGLIPPLPY